LRSKDPLRVQIPGVPAIEGGPQFLSPDCGTPNNPIATLRDGIFTDGVTYQLPTIRENATLGGYDAELKVGIAI
jgi:hypothetical protein